MTKRKMEKNLLFNYVILLSDKKLIQLKWRGLIPVEPNCISSSLSQFIARSTGNKRYSNSKHICSCHPEKEESLHVKKNKSYLGKADKNTSILQDSILDIKLGVMGKKMAQHCCVKRALGKKTSTLTS